LRRLAIHTNYRALTDVSTAGGFGRIYGPNVKADGSLGQAPISGYEVLAYAGKLNVTMMVQIPDNFTPEDPCIVTAPSSNSRGVYGAIGTAGEWGLKNNCAVAYTDAGKGSGAYSLQNHKATLIDGTLEDADSAGDRAHFVAKLSVQKREEYNSNFPYRVAFKHAHSKKNTQRIWGQSVLRSIEFAFYVLNEKYGEIDHKGRHKKTLKPSNTIVIASSVSNGAGASVLAAEQDKKGLIDGVAVSEPNVTPQYNPNFSIVQGNGMPLFNHSLPLADYGTLINIYQSCANAAPGNAEAPFVLPQFGAIPCAVLHAKNLLVSTTLAEQATEAQHIINSYGILPEQNTVQPSHWNIGIPQAISVNYPNSHGRFSVARNLCDYSFAAVDPNAYYSPTELPSIVHNEYFSRSTGIPPSAGIALINNASVGGAAENSRSISPSSGQFDQNLDGALCLRALVTDSNANASKRALKDYLRIQKGIKKIRATGKLRGIPTIFVTGRADGILAPNHSSRAYFGLNKLTDRRSDLHYYEVVNAHHLDAFNAFPGFNHRYIPLHHYYLESLDLMYDHLKNGTALPSSQVVRPISRGLNADTSVPDLDKAIHLPAIAAMPNASNKIEFAHNQVRIPD
jgi:hydroxybutyrate-dimer hydrolase